MLDRSDTYLEYAARINRVQDYIEQHLAGDLSLDHLAGVSGFSKFHFHRIFRAMTGETLLAYINRLRMEKAISLLLKNRRMSITQIGLKLGYSETAVFSRAVKRHFGMSATEIRGSFRKNRQPDSKNGQSLFFKSAYTERITNHLEDVMSVNANIEVKTVDEIQAVYLRYQGPYEGFAPKFQEMLGRLYQWAGARELLDDRSVPFTIYHDNYEFTDSDNLRTSVCLVVSKDVKTDGDIGKITIPSGMYAIGHYAIKEPDEHAQAWDYLYGQWLPNSGYQPDDGYFFDMYLNDPNTHPEKIHLIDLYIPVKPL